jgi:hypothetical protein
MAQLFKEGADEAKGFKPPMENDDRYKIESYEKKTHNPYPQDNSQRPRRD